MDAVPADVWAWLTAVVWPAAGLSFSMKRSRSLRMLFWHSSSRNLRNRLCIRMLQAVVVFVSSQLERVFGAFAAA